MKSRRGPRLPSTTATVALLTLAVACVAPRTSTVDDPPADLAVRDVNVVEVENGIVTPGRTVLIRGNRIVAVRPATEDGDEAAVRVIEGAGRYLIPGLWDMHAHLNYAPTDSAVILPAYVANGVTGIREMWSDPPGVWADSTAGVTMLQAMRLNREHIRAGRLVGPRLLVSSAPLDGPYGADEAVHVLRTADEARRIVERSAADGVDLVGTYRWLGPEAYAAAAEAARRVGLPVMGLAPITATFEELSATGHRVRDGLMEWELACSTVGDSVRTELRGAAHRDAATSSPDSATTQYRLHMEARPRLRETFDADLCSRTARRVARDGVWHTPRLVYGRPESSGGKNAASATPYLPRAEHDAWEQRVATIARDSAGLISAAARRERQIYRILYDAGIALLVGTESYFGSPSAWGFSVHDELVELVGIGLTPGEALRAATLEPARALGLADSLGTVAPGMLADLVLLEANPLEDIRNTTRIHAVIRNGRLLDRAALDALLEAIRQAASEVVP